MMLLPIVASAYDAEINGVFYEFDTNTREATVTFGDTKCTGSVTIPETVTYNDLTYSVTSIGTNAFTYCSELTSVTIPNSVDSINISAFKWCSSLRHVYCYAESVPKTKSNVFEHTSVSFSTLHVPAASIETYKVTSPWNEFYTIVAIDPSGVKTLESTQQDTDKQPDGKYMKNGKIIIVKEGKKYDAAGKLSAF